MQIWLPGSDEPIWTVREGDVSGLLPYSRMTAFRGDARPVRRSRVVRLHKDHFPEVLREFPRVGERLVWLMADRIREVAVNDELRREIAAVRELIYAD